VPIQDRLSKAQGGLAFANLARAFHLPPAKVESAVDVVAASLIPQIEGKLRSRRFLAKLIELFGKGGHYQVLESPTMLGTTATQVLGNDALSVIAGREVSKRVVREAAAKSEISEMLAEYLLPVVTAMLLGALAEVSRQGLERLVRGDADGPGAAGADRDPEPVAAPLPQVAASSMGFSGSTGAAAALTSTASTRLIRLSHCIKDGVPLPDGREAAEAARRVLVPYLALPKGPLDWIARLRALGARAFKTAHTRKR